MDEVFKMILTDGKINNCFQNLVGYWVDCGCEKYIHFDIDSKTDFDTWYMDAYRNFADWYSFNIWSDNIEINSNMVRIAMNYDIEYFGEVHLIDKIDNELEFNKHIIYILIIKYLEDEDNLYFKKFKNAMKNNFNEISKK